MNLPFRPMLDKRAGYIVHTQLKSFFFLLLTCSFEKLFTWLFETKLVIDLFIPYFFFSNWEVDVQIHTLTINSMVK